MKTYTGPVNQVTTIRLPSRILALTWSAEAVSAGGVIQLDVQTLFVAAGSRIKTVLVSSNGASHALPMAYVGNDRARIIIEVPKRLRGKWFARVTLPDHNLSMDSDVIRVWPPVRIVRAAWKATRLQCEEPVTLTAVVKDAPDGVEAKIEIFERDRNADLHPMAEWLAPVVDGQVDQRWYFRRWSGRRIYAEHETIGGYFQPEFIFRVTVLGVSLDSGPIPFVDWFQVKVCIPKDLGLEQLRYRLELANGEVRTGVPGNDGVIREEGVVPGPVVVRFKSMVER